MPHARTLLGSGVAIAALAAAPLVASQAMLSNAIFVCYYVVLAACWNLLAGYTGRYSLAQQAFAVIGAYTTGLLCYYLGVPIWFGILAGTAVATAVGTFLGLVLLRVSGTYLALGTWTLAICLQLTLSAAYEFTKGDNGLLVPTMYGQLSNLTPYYFTFVVIAGLCLGVIGLVLKSPIGSFLRAIRDDELRAATLGVNVTLWKTFAFGLTSMLSGLIGACFAHYVVVVVPAMAEFSELAKVIAMVLVGGMSTFWGPVAGAILIGLGSIYLQRYGQWDTVIYGVVVLIVMRFYRDGLLAMAGRGLQRVVDFFSSFRARGTAAGGR